MVKLSVSLAAAGEGYCIYSVILGGEPDIGNCECRKVLEQFLAHPAYGGGLRSAVVLRSAMSGAGTSQAANMIFGSTMMRSSRYPSSGTNSGARACVDPSTGRRLRLFGVIRILDFRTQVRKAKTENNLRTLHDN
jgi:hypothetical protein